MSSSTLTAGPQKADIIAVPLIMKITGTELTAGR